MSDFSKALEKSLAVIELINGATTAANFSKIPIASDFLGVRPKASDLTALMLRSMLAQAEASRWRARCSLEPKMSLLGRQTLAPVGPSAELASYTGAFGKKPHTCYA